MDKYLFRKLVYLTLGGLDRLAGRRLPVVVLCYHSLAADDWLYSVSLSEFKKQISFLARDYQFVTLADIYEFLTGKRVFPSPVVAVTFDDGYQDILKAAQFLQTSGVKPTVFVLSDPAHVERRQLQSAKPLLSIPDLRKLSRLGWEIGCHSATHPDFSVLAADQIRFQIRRSKQVLESQLGTPVRYFAYPKGRYRRRLVEAVKTSGYRMAFSMDDKKISLNSNLFTLGRVGVNRTHSLSEFVSLASPANLVFRRLAKVFLTV